MISVVVLLVGLQLVWVAAQEPWVTEQPYFVFQNKCISDLGCFYTGPPFYHPVHRPISLAPVDPTGTQFLLYSPSSPQDPPQLVEATQESVEQADFDPRVGTKVLIHGYTVKLSEGDVRFTMKDELMEEGPYNVIIVNWTAHNQFPYPSAVANARSVGALTAKLIQLLIDDRGISPENVHVIGHSLGGQMSGWVGERIPGLGRITGLDPAGPFFQHAENAVRLDTTDANFVDVIHSNGGDNPIEGYGIHETIGHMDFFPNGGQTQPGCFFRLNITTEFKDLHENLIARSCDHSRANQLFIESINRCSFRALQCQSYDAFTSGRCLEEGGGLVVAEMGLHSTKLIGLKGWPRFYLETGEEAPFCQASGSDEEEDEEDDDDEEERR